MPSLNDTSLRQTILQLTGDFIRSKRKDIGYNGQGVARAVGLPQSAISQIEQGAYPGLKYQTLRELLTFLNSSMAELDQYIEMKIGET